MSDVWRHLGDDGDRDAALYVCSEECDQLRVLTYVTSHTSLTHLRAGEIELYCITAGIFRHFCKLYPLLFLLSHDGGNDNLIGVILLEAPEDIKIHIHGVLTELLHVSESVEVSLLSALVHGVKTGRYLLYFLHADGLVENAAPSLFKGPGHHLIVSAYGR